MRSLLVVALFRLLVLAWVDLGWFASAQSLPVAPWPELIVTNDVVLEPGSLLRARLVVRASHVTIDGRGATLVGPGQVGDPASLAGAGVGVRLEGCAGVSLRRLGARGFATGLIVRDSRQVTVTDCDFSDNYHHPKHGWGELPARGGILLERARACVLTRNRANRVWDGLHLIESDDHLVADNDFSECSNTCVKLWNASRNRLLRNNLSYGLRIDRAAGEVHARDSTCVLIESGSDENFFQGNDITHGGDGVFIRVLNGWVSRGNTFLENDMSYANNNCVESWSPGNTYIRNRANHGSYGFWLGGSDQTVLVGNEAAYNGLTNGFHHAPQPGFGHGGIVIVGGPSSHTLIEGNHLHHNGGAGLAFRGDDATRGQRWRTHHWVVQQNRIEDNRWGVWGRWGDFIHLANNTVTNNALGDWLEDVRRLAQPEYDPTARQAPQAVLEGPARVRVGDLVRWEASGSRDFEARTLVFDWAVGDESARGPRLERRFAEPGFVRLGLTVHNGALAALAFRDVIVYADVLEIGTDGDAVGWSFEMENNGDGRGHVSFSDDPEALVGRTCLRVRPDPYQGAYVTAVYRNRDGRGWNWEGRHAVSFWWKAENPNLPGWQNAGPVLRLSSPGGELTLKPVKDGNLLAQPPHSEARWLWQRLVVPLAEAGDWTRAARGDFRLDQVTALSVALDSWGGDAFTFWLDGLGVD